MLAHVTRFVVGFGGAIAALILWWTLEPAWLAVLAALIMLVGSGVVAELFWRRLATPRQISDDLTDRVRNPPS